MTPAFALDLDHDGIGLVHRRDGDWHELGRVTLDNPDLDARLADLRAAGEALAPGTFATELIIPPSQILYTTLQTTPGERVTATHLRERLRDLTPVPVEELVFDWVRDGTTLSVALLERQTLSEAEAFADAHGFRPLTFSARPDRDQFPRDPDFGATSIADAVLADLAPPPQFRSRRAETADAAALARQIADRTGSDPEKRAIRPTVRLGLPEMPKAIDWRVPALVAGLTLVAVLVWSGYFLARTEGPAEPAAALSDVPPEVTVLAPEPAQTAPAMESARAPQRVDPDVPRTRDAPEEVTARADTPDLPALDTDTPEGLIGENPADAFEDSEILAGIPEMLPDTSSPEAPEIYLTSIDPVTLSRDAFALVPPVTARAEPRPVMPLSPPPAGTLFDRDEAGLVRATPDGALTPDGVTVTLAAPPLRPPPRPDAAEALPEVAAGPDLPDTRPRPRPSGLVEQSERVALGGRTREELSGFRPRPRPASAQDIAAAQTSSAASDLAVAASPVPKNRPDGFATRVAANRAVAAAQESDSAAPAPARSSAPNIPTSASVARQATIDNAIRLGDVNLIGVYGTEGSRRALVRLPSGRYLKVEVGDQLDGGRIAAISRNQLRYVKSGRNITLTVPSG